MAKASVAKIPAEPACVLVPADKLEKIEDAICRIKSLIETAAEALHARDEGAIHIQQTLEVAATLSGDVWSDVTGYTLDAKRAASTAGGAA